MDRSEKRDGEYKAVAQSHALGCAVACVASRCGVPYETALGLFTCKEGAWTRGYLCEEIVEALSRSGLRYFWVESRLAPTRVEELPPGTIVFLAPDERYPLGHYLVRVPEGWMNSWINYPRIDPARAGVEARLSGVASHLILETSA